MLALETKHGKVLHTGDWKFDPDPIVGEVSDDARLKELGVDGLMAVIGDSTNALVPGHSGSERGVQNELIRLFGTIKKRIIVTCFASNIARLKSIAAAAQTQRALYHAGWAFVMAKRRNRRGMRLSARIQRFFSRKTKRCCRRATRS